VAVALAAAALSVASSDVARAADYVPGEVVVGYAPAEAPAVASDIAHVGRIASIDTGTPNVGIVHLRRGQRVASEIARLRHKPGIEYAVPNYIARAAGSWIPNDPGRAHVRGGWQRLQWDFLATTGIDAPGAWANLRADGRPGARGVVVAVLDTGIAYRSWKTFRKSPDFTGTRFVAPYDFVKKHSLPLDREGHGTFVAGVIAEATNNGIGLTGLAYGASLMDVRVLGADGTGDAATISKGIRYAVKHGARVINLSLEFSLDVTSSDIPDIISAIRYAHQRGVVVVAAAGNEGVSQLAYPSAAPDAISVGATTRDRCLADYSNGGPHLDLVAPGGGDDSSLVSDPSCHPERNLPPIYQETMLDAARPGRFGIPNDVYGTSMSAPQVAAAAALVIASRVLGKHPSPDEVLHRLEQTAQQLGSAKPNSQYGYGQLDVAAATAPNASAAKH
jgi:serine protease